MWEILLPIFGFFIGVVASLTGIGGGVFIVPLLTLLYSFAPANAAGTSLTTIILTAVASSLAYARQKRIYYKTGLLLATVTAPGAVLGSYLSALVSSQFLGLFFGFFIIAFVAFPMAINLGSGGKRNSISNKPPQENAKAESDILHSKRKMLLGGALNFLGGIASGLLGIGGGALVVPTMTLIMGMAVHFATATSMFTIMFTSISGATQHYFMNDVSLDYALLLALGTVFGVQVGAYASSRISGKNLRRIFSIVIVVVGVQMILKYI
jgi:uncharacterized membrane protein YfcA